MNRFGGGWLTFLHNLSTSIFYWQWHFFIICLRLSSIFSVERHKVQFYVLIQPQIGSYPYLIFVDFVIVTTMGYALTVMIRPQRSCLGPWIISQEVPGNDTSEHNPFKKYFNPLHNTKTSSFSTALWAACSLFTLFINCYLLFILFKLGWVDEILSKLWSGWVTGWLHIGCRTLGHTISIHNLSSLKLFTIRRWK